MFTFILLFAWLAFPGLGVAAVYKCEDGEGNVAYSDRPCGTEAEKLEMQTYYPPSGQTAPGLRPGELEMLKQIEQREFERRQAQQLAAANDPLSAQDRQRLKELERRKDYIASKLSSGFTDYAERESLYRELYSIDREMAAIRGVPSVREEYQTHIFINSNPYRHVYPRRTYRSGRYYRYDPYGRPIVVPFRPHSRSLYGERYRPHHRYRQPPPPPNKPVARGTANKFRATNPQR
jgi:hypothetical protein